MNVGRIVRVVGPVIDVEFAPDAIPPIHTALDVDGETADRCASTLDRRGRSSTCAGNLVRAVAMSSTDGITRGMEAVDTGAPMKMPVGPSTLGRIFNVLGEPVDGRPDAGRSRRTTRSTARRPEYEDLEPTTEIFETGIKVVDLLEPYIKGGKTGLFGGAGVGKTVIIMELINNLAQAARRHLGVHRRGRAHP